MTTLNNTVSKLLTLDEVETDEDFIHTHYECDVQVALAGDSIWDCELTAADDLRIRWICVSEGVEDGDYDGDKSINVYYTVNGDDCYENSWRIYTDTGFEACVGELLGYEVSFTEQGMQEDGMAIME